MLDASAMQRGGIRMRLVLCSKHTFDEMEFTVYSPGSRRLVHDASRVALRDISNHCIHRMYAILCAVYLLLLQANAVLQARSNCTSPVRVYVYELPPSLIALAESARKNGDYHICKKCIYEQFSLEYIVYDYFTQHCTRTYNPAEADFFYLPIIREIDYRIALSNGGKRAPSPIEEVLLDAVEKNDFTKWAVLFNVTSEYWRRSNGSDHIIVMPAPVTNFRHQTNMRGFFHYMIQLQAPIFLNVEFSNSFVREYPVCATEKNVVMPYPAIDPDFYAGKLTQPGIKRDKLIFYLGGNHGSCVFIRNALTELSRDKAVAIQRGPRKREEGFQSATFCPIPIGDSPSSKRMYDVVNFGCVPVVLSDDLVWAYSTDTGGSLDPSSFSIQLPQSVILRSAAEILAKYDTAASAAGGGDGTAVHYLMNGGKALPSGVTVLSLLREIAAEDKAAVAEAAHNDSNSNSGATVGKTWSRRLLLELSEEESSLLESSNRRLLKGTPAAAAVGAQATSSNTLIRLLHKVSAKDVTALQQGVRRVATYFQFYAPDAKMRTDVTPPAVHMFPNGGAMQMLEQQLTLRKEKGVFDIGRRCQEERNRKGHKYIGNYPCEKRRR